MASAYFKELPRRAASKKALRDEAFNFAKSPKYDRYYIGFPSMVCKFI